MSNVTHFCCSTEDLPFLSDLDFLGSLGNLVKMRKVWFLPSQVLLVSWCHHSNKDLDPSTLLQCILAVVIDFQQVKCLFSQWQQLAVFLKIWLQLSLPNHSIHHPLEALSGKTEGASLPWLTLLPIQLWSYYFTSFWTLGIPRSWKVNRCSWVLAPSHCCGHP